MTHHEDIVVRGTAQQGHVRGFACITTELVNEMQRRHGTWPVATAALGRTASIASMMGLMLKNEERLTLQIKGDGPIGKITVDANPNGHVRGFVDHPHVHLPANTLGKLDVGGGVGSGMLYVIRDLGLKDYYSGSSELQTGEISDDFTYYFVVSEQTPSAVAAGVLVDTDNSVIISGGFIVQLMPGHTEQDIDALEQRVSGIKSVTDLLKDGLRAHELLRLVLPDVNMIEEKPITFQCTCSRERIENILKTLGVAEIQGLLDTQGQAEVNCHYCNNTYVYSGAELEQMIQDIQESSSNS